MDSGSGPHTAIHFHARPLKVIDCCCLCTPGSGMLVGGYLMVYSSYWFRVIRLHQAGLGLGGLARISEEHGRHCFFVLLACTRSHGADRTKQTSLHIGCSSYPAMPWTVTYRNYGKAGEERLQLGSQALLTACAYFPRGLERWAFRRGRWHQGSPHLQQSAGLTLPWPGREQRQRLQHRLLWPLSCKPTRISRRHRQSLLWQQRQSLLWQQNPNCPTKP